jgi:hypothetical protein
VPGLDLSLVLAASAGVLAYGPAPDVELIPFFLGLLTWVGVAFAAVLLAPLSALLRRLRRGRGAPPAEAKPAPRTAPVPESPGEGSPDSA